MIWIDLNLIVQVLLVVMHLNMKLAYDKCDENLPFDEWIQRQEGASDMLILIFIRSLRTQNFINKLFNTFNEIRICLWYVCNILIAWNDKL